MFVSPLVLLFECVTESHVHGFWTAEIHAIHQVKCIAGLGDEVQRAEGVPLRLSC